MLEVHAILPADAGHVALKLSPGVTVQNAAGTLAEAIRTKLETSDPPVHMSPEVIKEYFSRMQVYQRVNSASPADNPTLSSFAPPANVSPHYLIVFNMQATDGKATLLNETFLAQLEALSASHAEVPGEAAAVTAAASKRARKKKSKKGSATPQSGAVTPLTPVSQSDVLPSASVSPGPSSPLQDDLRRLEARFESFQAEQGRKINELETKHGLEINGLTAKIDGLKTKIKELKEKGAADRLEIDGLKTKIDSLQAKINVHETTIGDLQKKNRDIETKKEKQQNEANKREEKSDRDMRTLKAEVADLRSLKEEMTKKIVASTLKENKLDRRALIDKASRMLFNRYGISIEDVKFKTFNAFLENAHAKLSADEKKLLTVDRELRTIYSSWKSSVRGEGNEAAHREDAKRMNDAVVAMKEGNDRTAMENIHMFCQNSLPTMEYSPSA
ncbi:hypothetical protein FA95DRAFT_1610267 [Auriscalpium vulgare]|uniref:Uncharacterized protein n=1 Tax=Auriscalpium vulgare TaxID=40419 RepID=A0ACB8RDZ0_9AGAM|nr:hypothetical protein FA95DRAFT_1610267 [Auriscalpium vulgare]